MNKIKERKIKNSESSINGLWGPHPKIKRFKVSIFKRRFKIEIVSIFKIRN